MMNLKKFFVCCSLLIAICSCKKVLDVQPEYSVNGNQSFTNINDFEFTLQGTYSLFRNINYYGSFEPSSSAFSVLPDIMSDNMYETAESLGNEDVFSRWIYAADETQVENTWLAAYNIIAHANLILTKGIDKLATNSQGAVNRIKAQALAIRALAHFDLLRYWAEEYDRNSSKPGVPYITEFNYEVKPSRGTIKEDYDKIEADLKTARTLMDNMDQEINTGDSRAYIDQIGVDAILARMYLYTGQWDNAVKYATQVIDVVPLANINEFPKIWTDASNAEVIWTCVIEAGQNGPATSIYAPNVNRSQYGPNPDLVASYDPQRDIRYFSYFQDIPLGSDLRTVFSKYLAKESQLSRPDGVVNFKSFRVAEMYLIRAEANARLNNDAAALQDLNALREARIAGYTPEVLSGSALLDAIAMERRKELVGEGHRFFDLKRTTRTVQRSSCTDYCTLPPSSRAWTWPIPQPEIDANPSILPQNPGY